MDVIRHNFHAFDGESLVGSYLLKNFLQSFVNLTNKHLASVFYAPDKMIVDVIDSRSSVCKLFIRHIPIV